MAAREWSSDRFISFSPHDERVPHRDAFKPLQVASEFPGQRVTPPYDAVLGDGDHCVKLMHVHLFRVMVLVLLCQPSPLPFMAIFVYIDASGRRSVGQES